MSKPILRPVIFESNDTPGVWVGYVEGMRGVVAQADSWQQTLDNILETIPVMLTYTAPGTTLKDYELVLPTEPDINPFRRL